MASFSPSILRSELKRVQVGQIETSSKKVVKFVTELNAVFILLDRHPGSATTARIEDAAGELLVRCSSSHQVVDPPFELTDESQVSHLLNSAVSVGFSEHNLKIGVQGPLVENGDVRTVCEFAALKDFVEACTIIKMTLNKTPGCRAPTNFDRRLSYVPSLPAPALGTTLSTDRTLPSSSVFIAENPSSQLGSIMQPLDLSSQQADRRSQPSRPPALSRPVFESGLREIPSPPRRRALPSPPSIIARESPQIASSDPITASVKDKEVKGEKVRKGVRRTLQFETPCKRCAEYGVRCLRRAGGRSCGECRDRRRACSHVPLEHGKAPGKIHPPPKNSKHKKTSKAKRPTRTSQVWLRSDPPTSPDREQDESHQSASEVPDGSAEADADDSPKKKRKPIRTSGKEKERKGKSAATPNLETERPEQMRNVDMANSKDIGVGEDSGNSQGSSASNLQLALATLSASPATSTVHAHSTEAQMALHAWNSIPVGVGVKDETAMDALVQSWERVNEAIDWHFSV